MPRKDGREALRDMKADPALCRIPIVVLTTSRAEEDIVRTYGLGVNSFITKPVTFEGLVDALRIICRYWIEIVSLPPECSRSRHDAAPAAMLDDEARRLRPWPGSANLNP
jgi:two-component system response regulator